MILRYTARSPPQTANNTILLMILMCVHIIFMRAFSCCRPYVFALVLSPICLCLCLSCLSVCMHVCMYARTVCLYAYAYVENKKNKQLRLKETAEHEKTRVLTWLNNHEEWPCQEVLEDYVTTQVHTSDLTTYLSVSVFLPVSFSVSLHVPVYVCCARSVSVFVPLFVSCLCMYICGRECM